MLPLADFTPLSAQAQLAVVSLLAVLLIVLNILAHLRRKPPLDAELVKMNGAIEGLQSSFNGLAEKVRSLEEHRERDLAAQRTYTRETTREIFLKIDELKDSSATNFKIVERAIGQLEGKIESLRGR